MINPARWVVAEAWLNLGLRVQPLPSYRTVARDELQRDEELGRDFVYDGHGVWLVSTGDRRSFGYQSPVAPELGTDAMRHELAHYLIATDEQRGQLNFGLTERDSAAEARTIDAERVIDAMINACARIVSTALTGGDRR